MKKKPVNSSISNAGLMSELSYLDARLSALESSPLPENLQRLAELDISDISIILNYINKTLPMIISRALLARSYDENKTAVALAMVSKVLLESGILTSYTKGDLKND